jgi:hypothetical protein
MMRDALSRINHATAHSIPMGLRHSAQGRLAPPPREPTPSLPWVNRPKKHFPFPIRWGKGLKDRGLSAILFSKPQLLPFLFTKRPKNITPARLNSEGVVPPTRIKLFPAPFPFQL